MVASPCGSSRVVLRTTSPHRAASPVTTATAASASASAMAALSPVRARVRLPERSPMKARVLEARRKKKPWELVNILFPNVSIDLERSFFFFKCAFLEAFGWMVFCDVR